MSRDDLEDRLATMADIGNSEISSDGRLLIVEDFGDGVQIADPWVGENSGAPFRPGSDSAFKTDYEHNHELIDQSEIGPDGHPLNEMDQKFLYSELQEAEREKKSKQVSVIPASVRKAQRGGAAACTSGGPTVQVISWTGEEGEILSMIVALSAARPLATGDGNSYRPFALIRWGSDSTYNEMIVDITRGQQIVISGSSLYVSVGLDPAPSGENNGTMSVGASFGLFSGGRGPAPAQRTRYIDALGAAAVKNVVVPDFAVGVLPVQVSGALASGGIKMDFKDSNNVVRYSLTLGFPGQQTAPIPIAGDIYSIDCTNNDNVAETIRLVFMLSA